MLPLPSFVEIPFVPPPDPLPPTPTNFLPIGSRDAIISVGNELYDHIFPPNPPPNNPAAHISMINPSFHWIARIPPTSSQTENPISHWPPDDASIFVFLIAYGDSSPVSLAKPQETWTKLCNGLRILLHIYKFSPTLIWGPRARCISPWMLESVIESRSMLMGRNNNKPADQGLGSGSLFGGDFLGSTFSQYYGGAGTGAPVKNPPILWIPSEMFHYDPQLASYFARDAGVPENIIQDELFYWVSFFNNNEVPSGLKFDLCIAPF
jgi:hypothetical protein